MSVNASLSYFMSRVQGHTCNLFRLEPQNSSTATANQQIRFSLPSNALLNTRSFQLMFSATTGGSGARLPPVERLIDRYEPLAGGIQIAQGFSLYNVLRAAKDAMTKSHVDSVLGHPEYVREKRYQDGTAAITGTNNEEYDPANGATQFVIHLAGTEVLSSVAGVAMAGTAGGTSINDDGAGNQTFTLSNIRLNVETHGLASGVYDELVARRIAETGFIELPFKQYQSFQDSHTGSTKFSIATQSLDRIWMVYRAAAEANGGGGLVPIAGYKQTGGFTGATSGGGVTQDLGKPQYDAGGVLSTNREKYTGKYFNFSLQETGGPAKFQVQLNGSFVPQFQANAEEMYAITKKSVQGYDIEDKMTLDQYKKNYFVQCLRFNLPDSEAAHELSGVDSRSVNLQCMVNTTGITSGTHLTVFAEYTSTLRVGAARSIEVVS